MTIPTPSGADSRQDSASIGQLISDISDDLSRLFRQEVALAKAEMKQEAGKAGKAAGMLGGAGVAGHIVLLVLTFAFIAALSNVMDPAWAALIAAAIWGVIGFVLYSAGRKKLATVNPVPQQTAETLKEDAQWIRNPTG
ncbi:MAG TPA: phage holin family protein [Micromonosporaceae bacterium]|nr:phage holin family protein [Micromonosporaceae bacterium]